MAQVEASMRIDDEGTVHTLEMAGEEFENVGEKADKASQSLIDYERAQKVLEDGAFDMQEAILETHDNIDNLSSKLNAVTQVADSTGASFEQLVTEVDFDNFGESIRGLRDDLESGTVQAEELSNAFEELDKAQEKAAESADEQSDFQMDVVDANSEAAQEVEKQADANRELSNSQEQAAQSTRELEQATKRTTNASSRFRAEGAHTREIILSTGDAVQDLQFGLRGAGNNIAFLAENFVQAGSKAGSFTAVLKGVFGALKGPLGIIVALQALLAIGPKIAQWFEDRTEEAKDLEDAMKDAADSMVSFEEDIAGFEIESLEQAKNVRDELDNRISSRQEEIKQLERIKEIRRNNIDASEIENNTQRRIHNELVREASTLESKLGLQVDSVEKADELIQKRQQANKHTRVGLERVEGMVKQRKAQLELETVLENLGIKREQNEKGAADQIGRQVHETKNRIAELQEQIDKGVTFAELLEGDLGPEGLVGLMKSPAFEQSMRDVNEVISLFDKRFQNATKQKKRENLLALIRELQRLKEEMRGVKEQTRTLDTEFTTFEKKQAAVQALSQGIAGLADSFGTALTSAKSFGEGAKQVLGSIAQQIGKLLIAQGTAMIISSIFGDVSKIGQGSILIGVGSSLVASGAALTSGGGGGGGAGSSSPRSDQGEIGTGGSATTGIESRQSGGPVGAGRLYETHGMGEREFFVPGMDGAIMTQDQLAAASSSQSRQVNVNTESNVNMGVEEVQVDTKLQSLRLRLSELEQNVSEVT